MGGENNPVDPPAVARAPAIAASPSGLSALIARVEALEGPDREVDALIEVAVRSEEGRRAGLRPAQRAPWRACDRNHGFVDDGWTRYAVNRYTASLDAAVALVERVRPGVFWHVTCGRLRAAEPLYGAQLLFGSEDVLGIAEHPTSPAAALVLALLRSLATEGEG